MNFYTRAAINFNEFNSGCQIEKTDAVKILIENASILKGSKNNDAMFESGRKLFVWILGLLVIVPLILVIANASQKCRKFDGQKRFAVSVVIQFVMFVTIQIMLSIFDHKWKNAQHP